MRFTYFASLLSLGALARATAIPVEQATSCTNGPTSRNCWSSGFDINTDYDSATNGWPNTGKTVTYNLEITNSTCNPDGHGSKICFLINGRFPGPTITANWGDNVVVNVKNSMQDNGTSIHWHGVRQLNSVGSDGTNGLTECPLAPGQSRVYKWQATQYGTSWYHSHYSAQYGDGVLGAIVINGPASSNYDTDLGTFVLNDWWYQTAWQVNAEAQANQNSGLPGPLVAPPTANNILINGQSQDILGRGSYPSYTITSGKKYRLRFIGATADNYFHVSLDNHNFLVIAADFVPIKPFSTNYLTMGAGQRYDVIVTADQSARNYWLRVDVAGECQSSNSGKGRAIFTYAGFPKAIPLFSNSFIAPLSCAEPGPLVPVWNQAVPSGDFASELETAGLGQTTAKASTGGGNVVLWTLNHSIDIDYMKPTLSYVMNGNTSYPESYNLVPTSQEGDWNYWLMQQTASAPPIPHPMHVHGHDFFVLGSGSGTFSSSNIAALNFANPTRRDTVTIPANGWLAVAYPSNNPGAWLMHCHIAWHIAGGLGQQYLEAPSKIVLPNKAQYDAQCAAYKSWYATAAYAVLDSGL